MLGAILIIFNAVNYLRIYYERELTLLKMGKHGKKLKEGLWLVYLLGIFTLAIKTNMRQGRWPIWWRCLAPGLRDWRESSPSNPHGEEEIWLLQAVLQPSQVLPGTATPTSLHIRAKYINKFNLHFHLKKYKEEAAGGTNEVSGFAVINTTQQKRLKKKRNCFLYTWHHLDRSSAALALLAKFQLK